MPVCPNCGSQQPDGAAFCDECGAALGEIAPSVVPPAAPPAQPIPTTVAATCPVCGAPITPGEPFCENCGAALGAAAPISPPQAAAPVPPYSAAAPAPAQTPPPYGGGQGGGVLGCSRCGAPREPGSAFCDMCGTPVGAAAPSPPLPTPTPTPPVQPLPAGPAPLPAYPVGTAVQGRLVVQGTNATLPFPPGKTEIVVGREDPVSGVFPDVDLTDHGGDEGGVSRKHARIFIQGTQVFIEDLNSTNYTYVNQQRLTPGQPHPLNSGDEVRFGRVKLNFFA